MPALDIISVNVWQMLISLANLLILYRLLKRFLYKPVKKVLAERQAAIDERYAAADSAKEAADAARTEWESKMEGAKAEATDRIREATESANRRSEQILTDAREQADRLLQQTATQIELERQKADASVKEEIVTVSALLAEKMLQREIKADDHRTLIHSFLDGINTKNEDKL